MENDPDAIAAGIAGQENVTELWHLADRRVAAGDAAFVVDLGIALWRRYGGEDVRAPWQYRSIFDRVVRLLALSPGTVADAVRLMHAVGAGRTVRFAAALLASGHGTADDLGAALGAGAPAELRACLVHELVLRGVAADVGWAGEPWWREHPLAWLPAALTPLEGRPEVPRYTLSGRGGSIPHEESTALEEAGPAAPVRETTTPEAAAAIGAAVDNWAGESNGSVAAHTYALGAPLRPGAVAATLRSLGLECLQGLGGVGSGTAGNAWGQLFVAASSGGAYNAGEYGAYGRLAAWRSIGALAGAPAGATAAEVEAAANASDWYGFSGASGWFQGVAWDIGLATVAPGGRRLAILAATDTD
ncbi:DUF6183 family protein [Dactylosporangium sp. McL0621]|uniref:DUF6183 family protein n=1 Tax=Dactylosporangium sp. McL0621 TaxID=3415678 RepID=UPI003CECF2B3